MKAKAIPAGLKKIIFLSGCLALLAGCRGSSGTGRAAASAGQGQYDRMAGKISAAHKYLANKKVAVIPFSYTDQRISNDGVIVAERLLTSIINRRKLEVIERGLLEKVLTELNLQRSGLIDESTIKGLGKILGVEALVTGTLTRRRDGLLEVNARLIKTESAAVLSAAAENVVPDWESGESQGTRSAAAASPAPHRTPVPGRALLTARERKNCPPGMVLYWNFDAVTETTAHDVFGGHHAVLQGPAPKADGKVNSALDFKGTDYLKLSHRPELSFTKDVTIEAWVKYRSIDISESGSQVFCNGAVYCLAVVGAGNHSVSLIANFSGTPYRGGTILDMNKWHHAAVTYDGSRLTLYLDGKIDGSFEAAGRLAGDTRDVYIGWVPAAAAGYHTPVDGQMDEVAVYSRALSAMEIAGHYSRGMQGKGYCAI